MALVRCVELELPTPPPSISIPGYGELVAARRTINSITDPGELLMQLQNQLTAALGPLKRYVEMLDAMMALQNCMKAVPTAILTLDPSEITDCLDNLRKAVAILLSYIPPMSYIRMGCDIGAFAILCIDEITGLFEDLDDKLTQYIETYEEAVSMLDSELMLSMECSAFELKALALNLFDLIKAINVGVEMFMDFMTKYVQPLKEPAKILKDSMVDVLAIEQALKDGDQYLPDATKTEEELIAAANELHELIPTPPLEPMFVALNAVRNAMVLVYNILAPMVGLSADKTIVDAPEFVNF
jgi:hypothetical protein